MKFFLIFGKRGQKYQNIYIKALFESPNIHIRLILKTSKTWAKTACLGENWSSKK